MTRESHFVLHSWQGWKRPMTREKFRHGRYEVEPYQSGMAFSIHNTQSLFDYGDIDVSFDGEGVVVTQHYENQPFEFGSLAEFDELRDLITFLHGKAAEVAK